MVLVVRHVRCILDDLRLKCRKLIHVFCKGMWVSFHFCLFLFIFMSFIHSLFLFISLSFFYVNFMYLRSPSILLFFLKVFLVVNLMCWLVRHFGKMDWITWYLSYSKQTPTLLQLDFFWQHDTGQGFGAFVHEGPHGFSSNTPLRPGHVITNAPGFCKFFFI